MPKPYRPIVCIDFDGVLHAYSSGWSKRSFASARIADGPVPGAMFALVRMIDDGLAVAIHSSRSKWPWGRMAMQAWLFRHLSAWFLDAPEAEEARNAKNAMTWQDAEDDAREWALRVIRRIDWPRFKPAAFITIDDRALTFSGNWNDYAPQALRAFQPWNKRRSNV